MDDLQRFDLGWLHALELLLETHSVSEAARRAGMGQPAMSRLLARMRVSLGDPLLVRVGRGSELSPYGAQLRPRVRAALAGLRDALRTPSKFDPAGAPFELRVAGNDYSGTTLLAPWFTRARKSAPRLVLKVEPVAVQSIAALDAGELDFMIGPRVDAPSLGLDRFVVRQLWVDRFVCVMRTGHPSGEKRWNLDAYLSYEHVVVSTGRPGPAQVDLALTRLGRRRSVAATLPNFLLVPELLAHTDLIAMLPSRLLPVRGVRLARKPLPIELAELPTFLAWHPRSVADPRHRWARESLLSFAAALNE